MKLQILIPQYEETDEVIKPLLDSIAIQQAVDLADVGVIIVSDGGKVLLSDELIQSYPYRIEYYKGPHHGVSATRQAALNFATADYVMFCDADDMFCNVCGLYIIFREIDNGGFDSLISVFVEESRTPDRKEIVFINHEMDSTFVHGKVHRRQYLMENDIRWNPSLTIHEDSYFNILCQNLSTKVKYCQVPFYMWKWRDSSVCRHDPKYILKTYNNMLDSNTALVSEFMKRDKKPQAANYVAFMVFDAYYTMNKPEWVNQDNKEYRAATERRFAEYFRQHKELWDGVSIQEKMAVSNGVRTRSISEGMQMESMTIEQWLEKVGSLI